MAKISGEGKKAKKAAIAQKAAILFRKRGYTNTSMRDLAEALHIEAPSLYNHFGSKGEILEYICANVASGYMNHIEQIEKSTKPHTEKIEEIIRYHLNAMITDFDEQVVTNHEWKQLPSPAFNKHRTQRKQYEEKLVALIFEGMKKGAFSKRNPRVITLALLATVRGPETWSKGNNKISNSIIIDDITQLLIKGIIK